MRKGLNAAAIIVFLALAGWDTWEALGNLLGLPGFYEALGIADKTPWVMLIAGVVIPPVAAVIGLGVTRGRGFLSRALIYVIALAAISAVSMSLLVAEQAWRAQVLVNSLAEVG
jgi:hypothetical protein